MSHETLTKTVLAMEFEVRKHEDMLSEAKRLLRVAETQLAEAMVDGTVPARFDSNGYRWRLEQKTYVTPVDKDHTQAVVDAIGERAPDLIKPTIHAASRDKFLRETCLDTEGQPAVPDWLEGLVKLTPVREPRKARMG